MAFGPAGVLARIVGAVAVPLVGAAHRDRPRPWPGGWTEPGSARCAWGGRGLRGACGGWGAWDATGDEGCGVGRAGRRGRQGLVVVGGGQQLKAEAEPAPGLVLGDAEVGGGLAVVPPLEVGQFQCGPQRCGHGRDDVVGAGGGGGVADLLLYLGGFGGVRAAVARRGGFGLPQPLDGLVAGDPGDPGAQRALLGVVGVRVLPDEGEDLAGDAVGGVLVVEDAVGEAVHEGGEAVVQLAERGGLAAGQPLLHPPVPPRMCVVSHRTPIPVRRRRVHTSTDTAVDISGIRRHSS